MLGETTIVPEVFMVVVTVVAASTVRTSVDATIKDTIMESAIFLFIIYSSATRLGEASFEFQSKSEQL